MDAKSKQVKERKKIWCQKCCIYSLEDCVKELKYKKVESEEKDSFKECFECEDLKAKVIEL